MSQIWGMIAYSNVLGFTFGFTGYKDSEPICEPKCEPNGIRNRNMQPFVNPCVNPMTLKDAIRNPCWRLFLGQMAPP